MTANDFVFALTGYHPDFDFLERLGVKLDLDDDRCPVMNAETLESNVPGIYLAGVIVAGERTNEVFIENGRFHGKLIADHLRGSGAGNTDVRRDISEHAHLASRNLE